MKRRAILYWLWFIALIGASAAILLSEWLRFGRVP